MYLNFFDFKERPFAITPDADFLFLGKQQELALSTIEYNIVKRMGFSLLTGEVGAGKTTLARALLNRLDGSVTTALIINPLLSVQELLRAITKDFGIPVRINSPQRHIEALNNFLLEKAKREQNALVVIDEAQALSSEALEAVRLLTNLETSKDKLLQILLVGQPELAKKLKSHEMRQLNQRITVRIHLEPLSFSEMTRYINHRVSVAGGAGKVFFEPRAFRTIYRESKGYPRLINLICDRTLMAAYVRENTVIDSKIISSAIVDWKGSPTQGVVKNSPWGAFKRFLFS